MLIYLLGFLLILLCYKNYSFLLGSLDIIYCYVCGYRAKGDNRYFVDGWGDLKKVKSLEDTVRHRGLSYFGDIDIQFTSEEDLNGFVEKKGYYQSPIGEWVHED